MIDLLNIVVLRFIVAFAAWAVSRQSAAMVHRSAAKTASSAIRRKPWDWRKVRLAWRQRPAGALMNAGMARQTKKPPARTIRMTTAEATVGALLAHGLDTLYALPGVQNDHLFDALFKASDRLRTVHTRHEQGAAYMALGAALATGRPQAYAVVPGPGLLNSSAALLTAYSMNAPVLALVGEIPESGIGRDIGHLHELRDQAGVIARLVDFSARIRSADEAPRLVAQAMRAMFTGRPGPAALECAMDVWGKPGEVGEIDTPAPLPGPHIDENDLREAARQLGAAKRPLICVGGGAQDASAEVTALSDMLQAPVYCGFRRGQGVLDSRNPFAVTLPLGHELWREADVVIGIGTRLFFPQLHWGVDDDLAIIRIDADPEEPRRIGKAAVALIGDAKPILKRLIEVLPAHYRKRTSRREEMQERQARMRARFEKLAPQIAWLDAIRAELPEDGIFVDEVTQVGFVARLAFSVYKPRTFLSPGYQDNLGWGFATALGVQNARPDTPVVSINGDGGFMYTSNELATAVRHKIPLVAIVFNDAAFGNVRRIQQEQYNNRVIASDLANPDFVKFADSFGAVGERARTPDELRQALRRGFARRDGPTLIDVPVGPMPSPWEFIFLPRVRGV
jgi:acetolactate synthase I/II/III large subunit